MFNDLSLAPETCEKLFTPAALHIFSALSGVEHSAFLLTQEKGRCPLEMEH